MQTKGVKRVRKMIVCLAVIPGEATWSEQSAAA